MELNKPYTPWVRWVTLALLLIAAVTLSCFAFRDSIRDTLGPYHFSAREWVSLLTPIVAYFLAQIFHLLDERFEGGGIRSRICAVKRASRHTYDLNPSVIATTMTKQSVLTAIAAILLAVLQGYQQGAAPRATDEFSQFAARLSMIGFLVSILLLLVSMKCYDYACRFNLDRIYRAELVSKGLTLDIWSWYLLLFSLTVGVASINTTVSIVISFVAGYLLWWYYFIHPRSEKTQTATGTPVHEQDESAQPNASTGQPAMPSAR